MRDVAQTQWPGQVTVQLQTQNHRRPIGPVVAWLAAAATELQRVERAGAAHVFQDSIGGRGGACQSGLAAEPALTFFGQDAGREMQPPADAATIGGSFRRRRFLACRVTTNGVADSQPRAGPNRRCRKPSGRPKPTSHTCKASPSPSAAAARLGGPPARRGRIPPQRRLSRGRDDWRHTRPWAVRRRGRWSSATDLFHPFWKTPARRTALASACRHFRICEDV